MKPEELAELREMHRLHVGLAPENIPRIIQIAEERNEIAEELAEWKETHRKEYAYLKTVLEMTIEERDEAIEERNEAIELLRRYVDEPSCQIFDSGGFPDYSAHDFLAEIDKEES